LAEDTFIGELVIIFVLVLASAVLAGAEIAVIAVRKSRLAELVGRGSRGAQAVRQLREQPERFLATVQVGITVIGATAAAFGGRALGAELETWLRQVPWLAAHARSLSLGLVVVLISYLSVVLGELVPKSLALRAAEPYALMVGRPLWVLSSLARPLVWLLGKSSNLVLRLFKDRTTFTETRLSPTELSILVDEATRDGSLHPGAAEIARRAIDFGDIVVADVMVPRTNIVALSADSTHDDIRRVMLEAGHSYLPIYGDSLDDLRGLLARDDVLALAWERPLIILDDLLRPPLFVPETMHAVDVLRDMQRRRERFAVVVDERGGTAGIVTLNDLFEELVGELFREPGDDAREAAQPESGGWFAMPGGLAVRDANRDLPFELPEGGDWSTVGGLVVTLAGRIPMTGDRFATGEVELEVIDATPRRVRRVRARALPSTELVSSEARPTP
jgi:putative hemolysin